MAWPNLTRCSVPGAAAAILLVAPWSPARAAVSIPTWTDKAVHDYAGVVLVEDSDAVEAIARAVREESGLRLTAVTVKSLEGETPEELAARFAREWNIGQGEAERSLLLLVAAGDGQVALEASPAAGEVFNEQARRTLVEDAMGPYVRRGDYSLGVRRCLEEAARMAARGYGFEPPEELVSDLPESLLARGGSLVLLLGGILVVALGLPALLWWLLLGGRGGREEAD